MVVAVAVVEQQDLRSALVGLDGHDVVLVLEEIGVAVLALAAGVRGVVDPVGHGGGRQRGGVGAAPALVEGARALVVAPDVVLGIAEVDLGEGEPAAAEGHDHEDHGPVLPVQAALPGRPGPPLVIWGVVHRESFGSGDRCST
ncbi:hypothetical protein GCM10029992_58330 [Glycomyces albus]